MKVYCLTTEVLLPNPNYGPVPPRISCSQTQAQAQGGVHQIHDYDLFVPDMMLADTLPPDKVPAVESTPRAFRPMPPTTPKPLVSPEEARLSRELDRMQQRLHQTEVAANQKLRQQLHGNKNFHVKKFLSKVPIL